MIAYKSRDTGLLYIAINSKLFLYEDLEISDNLRVSNYYIRGAILIDASL